MTKNKIISYTDKIKIITQNNNILYYNDKTEIYDMYNVITVGKVGSQNFDTILIPLFMKRPLTHSLLKLKEVLNTSNNFIIVGIRNPIDRNLSYFYNIGNIPNNELSEEFQTKKNNYQSQIINFSEKIINKSITDTIDLYFNTDIHNQFNEWFSEFFEITGINQKTFNKTEGLDFYELPNNNKIMIYTLEKFNSNLNNFRKIFRLENCPEHNINNIIVNAYNSNDCIWKDHYNTTKSQITYTQSYLDSQLNTDIMKFFYSDEDIQGFYNKYTVQN